MSNQLEVSIGADIKGLMKALKEATDGLEGFDKSAGLITGVEKSLKSLRETAKNATNPADIAKYNAQIEKLEHSLTDLNKIGRATPTPLQGVDKNANAASMAVMNFGRVAQDAAFGPMAIANNLNPLLESFQRLRAESKSNVGALKALGASLVGGGGLGLAFSAITAAMSFAQVGMSMWTRRTKEAKESTRDYADTLNATVRAQLKGSQEASKEIVSLRALYTATQSTTLSIQERKKAVDELQKQYPGYFGNLKDEDILAGKASKAYDKLAGSIIAASRARAAQDIITKNANRELENEQRVIDLQAEQVKLETQKAKLTEQVKGSGQGAAGYAAMIVGIENRINENIRQQNNLKTDTVKLNKENLRLEQEILKYQQQGGVVDPGGSPTKTPKGAKEPSRFGEINYGDAIGLNGLGKRITAEAERQLGSGEVKPVQLNITPHIPTDQLYSQGEILKEYFQYDIVPQLQSGFNNFFNEALVHGELSFKTLGESIKNTFASVLANEATVGLLSLLSGGNGSSGKKGGGLFAMLGGLFAKGGGGAAAGGAAASGGALLPVLAGGAVLAGMIGLFGKKKKSAPVPQSTIAPSVSSSMINNPSIITGSQELRFRIQGYDLVTGYDMNKARLARRRG